jgi:hypothetical protein
LPREALRRCPACRMLETSNWASIMSIQIHSAWNSRQKRHRSDDVARDHPTLQRRRIVNFRERLDFQAAATRRTRMVRRHSPTISRPVQRRLHWSREGWQVDPLSCCYAASGDAILFGRRIKVCTSATILWYGLGVQKKMTSKLGGRHAAALCESPWLVDRRTFFNGRRRDGG